MSRHIIHILKEGSYLYKKRGFLVCQRKDKSEKSTPLKDIKALVMACRSGVLSVPVVESLLENKAVILHCDASFCPIGFTMGISNIINKETTFGQVYQKDEFQKEIWNNILHHKIQNQINLLNLIGCDTDLLSEKIKESKLNESICARIYFSHLFGYLSDERVRRRKDHDHPINQKLNYGYAVLSALCHRSIVAHGLLPQFGLQHRSRYRSHPLVYDLMECLRPFIDACLVFFYTDPSFEEDINSFNTWCKLCAQELYQKKIPYKTGNTTLLEAIDIYIKSLCLAFSNQKKENLWIPEIDYAEENLQRAL